MIDHVQGGHFGNAAANAPRTADHAG
jgi:hypothetical protein